MKRIIHLVLFAASLSVSSAATYYIDGNLMTGANDGSSWANAKQSLSFSGISLVAGDTVYISGGASGLTATYNMTGEFTSLSGYKSGTAGNPITYKIGQDSAHNGTAIFHRSTYGSQWLFKPTYVTFSGDAGDGQMHFKLENFALGSNHTTSPQAEEVHLTYINFGELNRLGVFNPVRSLEVDHCYAKMISTSLASIVYASVQGDDAYGNTSFHHNTLLVPYDTALDGWGSDCFQVVGKGYDIYNNTVSGYALASARGDHQDGWQAGSGSYIRIYNNRFTNIQNYALYAEPANGAYSHVRIHDNIAVITVKVGSQAIAVAGTTSKPASDVVVSNNVAAGYRFTFTFRDATTSPNPAAFSDCYFYNNVATDIQLSGANIIDPNVTAADNVDLSNTDAGTSFVSFTAGSESNDFHLVSGASLLINEGTDASSLIGSLDADGAIRSIPWSIGAYNYTTPGAPTFVSATIPSAGASVSIVWSASCTTGGGGAGGMTMSASGGSVTLTYASGSGSTIYIYNTSRTVLSTETISGISYTQPGSGIEATSGGVDVDSFSDAAVVNNSTQVVAATISNRVKHGLLPMHTGF